MMDTPGLSHWADVVVVLLYFGVVLGIGLKTLCQRKGNTVQSYFLAGRTMPWFAVGASLFASNIGSEHFVGLAGAGAAAGIALVLFEWFPIFLILLLGWVFVPVYISAGVYTLPEYIERRHGGRRIRMYLSCLALVLYVITKLAAAMFSGALFIQLALRWDMYVSLAVLLTITGIYTVLGGLTAVMYTDTFQTVVMVIGSAVVMVASFIKIGGYQNLERLYFEAVPSMHGNNTTCGLPRSDAFHVFQDPVTGDQPWPGLILQSSLGCLWYWCCDQVIVQRSLAARSLSHAKGGSLLAGILKILPLFLLIFPGMISRILFTDEVACTDPDVCRAVCDNPVGCSNIAYPKLVLELLPVGARGLLMAVMLSAIMSSLTSIFNSASTVFTMDVWRRVRPSANQRELLIVGRVFVVAMCVIAILWVPMVKAFQSGRLFSYMVAVEGYIGSPLGVLFILSIFWRRTTEAGAFYGIILGHLCGVSRLAVELAYPAPPCGEVDTRPAFLSEFHYSYFVQLQLVFTSCCIVAISLCTTPRSQSELEGVTWWTKYKPFDEREPLANQKCACVLLEGDETGIPTNHKLDCVLEAGKGDEPSGVTASVPGSIRNGDTEKQSPLLQQDAVQQQEVAWVRRLFSMVCGLGDENTPTNTRMDVTNIRHFLSQRKSISTVLNGLAIVLMTGVAFITGFYR